MNRFYAEVAERAGHHCEYCKAPEVVFNFPFEVEHVIPPCAGGASEPANLALACRSCNVFKSAVVQVHDEVSGADARLFHPRIDEWTAHFKLADNGQIQPLTPTGRITVRQLRLIPHAAENETFSRNANGVRAIYVLPAFSPTPLALGLNVKGLIHGRARYNVPAQLAARLHWQQLGVYPG